MAAGKPVRLRESARNQADLESGGQQEATWKMRGVEASGNERESRVSGKACPGFCQHPKDKERKEMKKKANLSEYLARWQVS